MTDLPTLHALADRIERAAGPDREIDVELWARFGSADTRDMQWSDHLPTDPRERCNGMTMWEAIEAGVPVASIRASWKVPAYTASLDAAVALVERALPGWAWSCGTCVVSNDGWVKPDMRPKCADSYLCDLFDDGFFGDAKGGSVPLSILSAMMQGLIARETVRAGLPFKSHLEARREAMKWMRHNSRLDTARDAASPAPAEDRS